MSVRGKYGRLIFVFSFYFFLVFFLHAHISLSLSLSLSPTHAYKLYKLPLTKIPKEIEEMGEVVDGLDGDQSMVAKLASSVNTGALRRGRQKKKKRLEKKSQKYVSLRQGKWEEMWSPEQRQFVYVKDLEEGEEKVVVKRKRPISFIVDDDQLENVLPIQPDISPPFLRGRRHAVLCILRGARARAENRMVLCEWGCGKWMVQGETMRIHQKEECIHRITQCNFGCPLSMEAHLWVRDRAGHEKICPRRLVRCVGDGLRDKGRED